MTDDSVDRCVTSDELMGNRDGRRGWLLRWALGRQVKDNVTSLRIDFVLILLYLPAQIFKRVCVMGVTCCWVHFNASKTYE